MLPKNRGMALICGLVVCSVLFGCRLAQAQSGPCSEWNPSNCLGYYLSYYTNQVVYSGSCNASTLPSDVATTVAGTTIYPFSSNPWDGGLTGEMVLTNPSTTQATTFQLAITGGYQFVASNVALTILAGDTIVVPFTSLLNKIPSSDSNTFEVTITPAANLTCQTVSFYTWAHD
jgi:hypothetical protein